MVKTLDLKTFGTSNISIYSLHLFFFYSAHKYTHQSHKFQLHVPKEQKSPLSEFEIHSRYLRILYIHKNIYILKTTTFL